MTVRTLLVVTLIALATCSCNLADTDLSHTSKYRDTIGKRYRTKTPLFAHGLKDPRNPKRAYVIWVSPSDSYAPEHTFSRAIPIGQVFTVAAVRKQFVLLENGLQFIVRTEGLNLPEGLEIAIPLYGYMESSDGFPDPSRFEPLGR